MINFDFFQVIYLAGRSPRFDSNLREESDQFGDLVVNNAQDSYENLTLKTLSAMDWMQRLETLLSRTFKKGLLFF